jgi:peptidoglycan/xylan/chitin deacetylase (PgdA/CDA1 family)
LNKKKSISPIRTYRDFTKNESFKTRTRTIARNAMIGLLSAGRSIKRSGIRFPYYHHVFDDERQGFARQLKYMANQGDFISLNDAISMLDKNEPIDGNYFCITFDDGFKNWSTNATPLLLDAGAMATFFVVTGFIGTSVDSDQKKLLDFYQDEDRIMEFLNWEDCRSLSDAGMTIGSHTMNHVHLADLDDEAAQLELKSSKEFIEAKLGRPCDHFCCPFGREGIDYLIDRHPKMAKKIGYKSFLTGQRGLMQKGNAEMVIKRDHLLAGWGDYQLKYFFHHD